MEQSIEAWENHPDISSVKDEVLRDALRHVFGTRSAAYFWNKAEKIKFIKDELARPRLLELAATRRTNYRKPTPRFAEKVLRAAGAQPWHFVEHTRNEAGATDPFSGRVVKKVVVLERFGRRVECQPRSAQVLLENDLLVGWVPERAPRPPKPPKRVKGVVSIIDLLEREAEVPDPEPAVSLSDIDLDDLLSDVPVSDPVAPEPAESERSLDDLLSEIFG